MSKTKLSSEYFCLGKSSCRRERSKSMLWIRWQRHDSISNTQKQYASCWTINSISHSGSCLPLSTSPRKSKMFIRNMKSSSEWDRKVVNLFCYSNPLHVLSGHLLRMGDWKGWKGLWRSPSSTSPAKAGSPKAGCAGLHPSQFLLSP